MTTPAAAPPASDLTKGYEIVLPEGLTVEQLISSANPPGKPGETAKDQEGAAAPASVAAPPAKPQPEAGEKPPSEAAPPGVIAERRKRQDAERRNQELDRQLEQANRETDEAREQLRKARRTELAKPPKIVVTKEDRDALLKRVRPAVDEAKDQGEVAGIVLESALDFFTEKVNGAFRESSERVAAAVGPEAELAEREATFKRDHPDYDNLLDRAGVFAAVRIDPQSKQPANPGLSRLIYGSPDPVAKAYDVARRILVKRGELKDDEGEESPTGERAVDAVKPSDAAPGTNGTAAAPPAKAADAQAPKPDASVADERGRGIRTVPSAGGPPRVVIDHDGLKRLELYDPERFLKIMESNPTLEFEYYTKGM